MVPTLGGQQQRTWNPMHQEACILELPPDLFHPRVSAAASRYVRVLFLVVGQLVPPLNDVYRVTEVVTDPKQMLVFSFTCMTREKSEQRVDPQLIQTDEVHSDHPKIWPSDHETRLPL